MPTVFSTLRWCKFLAFHSPVSVLRPRRSTQIKSPSADYCWQPLPWQSLRPEPKPTSIACSPSSSSVGRKHGTYYLKYLFVVTLSQMRLLASRKWCVHFGYSRFSGTDSATASAFAGSNAERCLLCHANAAGGIENGKTGSSVDGIQNLR